ncbi:hypothetical protein [Kribbella sp. CA-294648]|uniref:hypothetical protein n=1 Tax=Kribbella sp. CA-294648 TaxID=3239948 RepID=UPI003D8E1124
MANSSPASAASSASGERSSGAPLGQRPTSIDASRTGVVPMAVAAVVASSQKPATFWSRRRHTRYEPRRAQSGNAVAGGAGVVGS